MDDTHTHSLVFVLIAAEHARTHRITIPYLKYAPMIIIIIIS